MAKALLGHLGSAPDARLVDEVRRLRARISGLEHEVELLRAANARLSKERLSQAQLSHTTLADDDILSLTEPALSESLDQREPAYT